MRINFAVLICFLICTSELLAQPGGGNYGLGVKAGLARYYGDVKNSDWKPHYGLSIYKWLDDYVATGLEIGFSSLHASENDYSVTTDLLYAGFGLKGKLLPNAKLQPYGILGIEGFKFNPKDDDGDKLPNNAAKKYSTFGFGFQLGGGISYAISSGFSIDMQMIYHPTFTDHLDDLFNKGSNDNYITTAIKLTLFLGEDKDSDGDGIPDKIDNCPKEKEDLDGFKDDDGCPDPDNDNDGIMDKMDKCPNVPEDFDNFQDKDGCPDLDNDNDGIPDKKDKCPGTDKTLANNIDTKEDQDGFADDDGCPDLDNDNDGIPDNLDKCPNNPETFNGWEDQDGCPDVVPVFKVELGKPVVLKGVYFKLGSAELDPNSEDILDQAFNTLKDNPHIEVEIRGHTDNSGSAKRNKDLSKLRAETVKKYLVIKGIKKARLSTKGFGSENPLVPNDSKKGQARNRRIEFFRIK